MSDLEIVRREETNTYVEGLSFFERIEAAQWLEKEKNQHTSWPDVRIHGQTLPWVIRRRQPAPVVGDLKEALGSRRKPDITHTRLAFQVYNGRNGQYGDEKYKRANYMRPAGDGSIKAEFERHREYLRAIKSHTEHILDAMELHQALDPDLQDEAGMIAAVRAPDTDTDGTFPPSMLPHHGGIAASINMAIAQAVQYGLLPADPGQPWKEKK